MRRTLRKDALTHRTALLKAAAEVMSEQGFDAPLDAVAVRAGVGRATLYRNFPDRIALASAVLSQSVDALEARAAARGPGPEAFLGFIDDLAEGAARNAGFSAALRLTAPEALAPLRLRLMRTAEAPLQAAKAAGLVRTDLTIDDIPVIIGLLGAGWRGDASERAAFGRRALALVLDGLRARP